MKESKYNTKQRVARLENVLGKIWLQVEGLSVKVRRLEEKNNEDKTIR